MILFTQGRWLVVAFRWHKDMPHASISFHQPIQFTCFWTKVLAGNMIAAWKGWEMCWKNLEINGLNETDKCYCFLSTKPPQDIPQQAVLRCLCRENVPWIHWITLTKQITVPLYLPLPYSPKHSGFSELAQVLPAIVHGLQDVSLAGGHPNASNNHSCDKKHCITQHVLHCKHHSTGVIKLPTQAMHY